MSVLVCSQCGARVSRVHGVSGQTDLFGIIADDRATADASTAVRAGRVLCSGCARTSALPGFGAVPENREEGPGAPASAPIGPGVAPEADPPAPEAPTADRVHVKCTCARCGARRTFRGPDGQTANRHASFKGWRTRRNRRTLALEWRCPQCDPEQVHA